MSEFKFTHGLRSSPHPSFVAIENPELVEIGAIQLHSSEVRLQIRKWLGDDRASVAIITLDSGGYAFLDAAYASFSAYAAATDNLVFKVPGSLKLLPVRWTLILD